MDNKTGSMAFIRTVNGDIDIREMGITYSHEHIVIEESFPTQANPAFLLNDVKKIALELQMVHDLGGRTMIDTMPANCGRNVVKLAEVSTLSGIHIVAPTGLHLEMYYPSNHWRYDYSADQLAALFVADIEEGVDLYDYNGPLFERTRHKAGLIKLATADENISGHQTKIFHAVSNAHLTTGAPILTHTNSGKHALAQAHLFEKLGVNLSKVVISHVDKHPDPEYVRDVLQTGVRVEFDSAFRWKSGETNRTYALLEKLLPEFPDQITVGMDAAKNTYWKSYGGAPGLDFLLNTFRKELEDRGLHIYWDKIMIYNPASLYRFNV
jgi:predicted metal-dependent phosphotriesterase family hydrolase